MFCEGSVNILWRFCEGSMGILWSCCWHSVMVLRGFCAHSVNVLQAFCKVLWGFGGPSVKVLRAFCGGSVLVLWIFLVSSVSILWRFCKCSAGMLCGFCGIPVGILWRFWLHSVNVLLGSVVVYKKKCDDTPKMRENWQEEFVTVCEQHLCWLTTSDAGGFTRGVCNGLQTKFNLSRRGYGIRFPKFHAISCLYWNENEAMAGNIHPFGPCLRVDAGIKYVWVFVCVYSLYLLFSFFQNASFLWGLAYSRWAALIALHSGGY